MPGDTLTSLVYKNICFFGGWEDGEFLKRKKYALYTSRFSNILPNPFLRGQLSLEPQSSAPIKPENLKSLSWQALSLFPDLGDIIHFKDFALAQIAQEKPLYGIQSCVATLIQQSLNIYNFIAIHLQYLWECF